MAPEVHALVAGFNFSSLILPLTEELLKKKVTVDA